MVDLDQAQPVSIDSYSSFTPLVTVGVMVNGVRRSKVTYTSGGIPTELICDVIAGNPPELDMDKLNEIDGRLRTVENDISTIKERLQHMPKTTQMWMSMGTAALLILGGMWTLLSTVGANVVETAVKGIVVEEVAKTPSPQEAPTAHKAERSRN